MSAASVSSADGMNCLTVGGANTAENEHTPEELKELQSMDWQSKVLLTQARIIEFYGGYHPGMGYGNAYISFSGGKDSTVLLHIARQIYPDIPAVFSNTGLEYPEIQSFARSHDNVEVVTPKMRFDEVISKYGYPLIGKEVAEAIYYARRLSRERERETADHLLKTSGHRNRRTVLMGAYPDYTHTHTQRNGRTPQTRNAREPRRRQELNGNLTQNEQFNRERRTGVAKPFGSELKSQGTIRESETSPG